MKTLKVAGHSAALIALLLTGVTAANAKPFWGGQKNGASARPQSQMMQQMDLNKDGLVTKSEAAEAQAKLFAQMDKDNNSEITLAEFKASPMHNKAPRLVRTFQRLDLDGNGKITEAEAIKVMNSISYGMERRMGQKNYKNRDSKGYRQNYDGKGFSGRGSGPVGVMGMMAEIDSDRNGKLSEAEIQAFTKPLFANGDLDLNAFKQVTAKYTEPMQVKRFQSMDDDGNLVIPKEEFTTQHQAMFNRLDRNSDGVISSADRQRKNYDRKDRKGKHHSKDRHHSRKDCGWNRD
ncbi:hypothetical protein [Polycladidibacter stylochi]|uniref:hypothetical protein n=1 Tax=Polycladidibacter stylochi TaxID=1807766 RepID=UPI00082FEBD7|nr:hypothetical protein [Pseudovibrio stylochi]